MVPASCSIKKPEPKDPSEIKLEQADVEDKGLARATFAGGCFWCIESAFEGVQGVSQAVSGYTGGESKDPTYYNHSDHREAVQVVYDPETVTYRELLDTFWRQIDPTDAGGQFADRGHSYTTAVYYHTNDQKELAEQSKVDFENSGKYDAPIVTEILTASEFYVAEEVHQDYAKKNAARYGLYKEGSGRAGYIENTWGSK